MEPDLDQARRRAKELLRAARAGDAKARLRLRADRTPRLSDAQRAIARDLGFASWAALVRHVGSGPARGAYAAAPREPDSVLGASAEADDESGTASRASAEAADQATASGASAEADDGSGTAPRASTEAEDQPGPITGASAEAHPQPSAARAALAAARAGWSERGEVVLDMGVAYAPGRPVRLRVRKRGRRYDLDDLGGAVAHAQQPPGWRAVAEQVVEQHGLNVNRPGRVFVQATEGRDIDALAAKVADTSLAVYAALLDLDA